MHPSPTRPKKAFPVTIPRVLLIALSLALAAMILAGALSGPGAQAQGPVPPTPTTVPTGDHQDPDDGSKTGDSPSENAARPTITLARHQTSITEGQRLDFILTASSAPSSNLNVNVSVVDNGNFLTGTVPTIITIAGGNTTAWLILFTSDDSTVESDAYITATINTGTGYFRGTTYQRSILVNDNDPAPPTSLNLTASNDDLALAYSRSVSPHRYQFQLHRAGSQNGTYSLVRTANDSISPANFNNLSYQFWYKSRGRNCVYSNRTSCGPWSQWSNKVQLTNLPPPANLNITVSGDDLTLTYTRSSSPHYYQFRLRRASGECGPLPAASHQPTGAGTPGLPLPAEGSDDHPGEPGVGGRHHLPAHGPGIPVPGGHHGLAQPVRGGLGIVQHSGDRLLCRGPDRGPRPRKARRIQHRPGKPVHQPRVHADTPGPRGEDQHGWQGQVPGQHTCRAAMEDGEVRGGLPEGLR